MNTTRTAQVYPLAKRPRRARLQSAFTLVEVMVATVLLTTMIVSILGVLISSYRIAAKARYDDHARYIVKSFADQFLTQQSTDTSGNTLTMWIPTSATGVGLTWVTTNPTTSLQTTYTGTVGPTYLQVPLSDTTTGETPVIATISRTVYYIDPSTTSGNPSMTAVTKAAGTMLRGDFSVYYSFQGVQLPTITITALRATP